ncbi:MAG: barstar family protein [Trueperaceae bacterium]|nr:barstar family protein [Trueperaceae bacterium]
MSQRFADIQHVLSSDEAIVEVVTEIGAKELTKILEKEGYFAVLVDRAPVFNKDTLLHAFYQGCEFPAYFGFNWDALEDCLLDFSWIIAEMYVLIFQNYEVLRERTPEVAETLEAIIKDVALARHDAGRKKLKMLILKEET